MIMTSAYANKYLRKLDEDKNYILSKESAGMSYTATESEEPLIPDYDFHKTCEELAKIDAKVRVIKHAINMVNITNTIDINGEACSIDTVLVRMSQVSRRKDTLNNMRRASEKMRLGSVFFSNKPSVPEYRYANYSIEEAAAEYERLEQELAAMQIALDRFNQTFEFEVDL